MIYLAVRIARNSTTVGCELSDPGESDQFWLDPSEQLDEYQQPQMPDEAFDDSRVQWFRSPKIAYVLREF